MLVLCTMIVKKQIKEYIAEQRDPILFCIRESTSKLKLGPGSRLFCFCDLSWTDSHMQLKQCTCVKLCPYSTHIFQTRIFSLKVLQCSHIYTLFFNLGRIHEMHYTHGISDGPEIERCRPRKRLKQKPKYSESSASHIRFYKHVSKTKIVFGVYSKVHNFNKQQFVDDI